MKSLLVAALLCVSLGSAAAQATKTSKPAAARKAASSTVRSECVEEVGLCVNVPAPWQRLGNIFDDLGFVVAEPHAGADSATWPQLSVAAIDLPPQKTSGAAPTLDSLIDVVLTPDGTFTSSETQQRTRLLLNGANAEILRVKLHNDTSQADSIEEIALIEGDEGLVYSIALRCAPQEFDRLEAVFQKTVHSWRIKPPAAQPAPPSKPPQDSDKK